MIREPKRLRRSEQGALRAGLEAAHAGLPNREQLDALAERLRGSGVALPPDVGERSLNSLARARALAEPKRLSLLVRIGVASLIVGVGVLPWLLRGKPQGTPVTLVASAPAVSVAPAPLANVVPEQPRIDRPTVSAARTKQEVPAAPVAAAVPITSSLPVPRTTTVVAKRTLPADSTVRASAVNRSAATSLPSQHAPGDISDELPASATPETELALLKQARNALNGDPLNAYALSERCAREFPRGAFAQEREFIAISALHRLGRDSEAERRADSFRSRYPRSAYSPQLERMFGGGAAP
jgi:hypothetical protein